MKELTGRLLAVAELIPDCESLADIGCDHAFVSIYAAERKIAEKIIAADINPGPLENARREIAAAGLSDKIKTHLGAGLCGIEPCDCVVIAGMGGELIADIISAAGWVKGGTALVLQPMTRAETLREYLYENGFEIEKERLIREDGRIYCAFRARGGKMQKHEPYERYISRAALGEEAAAEYTSKLISRLEYEYNAKKEKLSENEKLLRESAIKSLCEMRRKQWQQ